jgi:hypothetical protein
LLALSDDDIPAILDPEAELLHALGQPRDAERRRAHVDAAPAGAQVEWDADDADFLHRSVPDGFAVFPRI